MAYMFQIACITILAEVLLRVIPVAAAGFRYAYWRLVLAAALVMPWVLRTTAPVIDAGGAQATPTIFPATRFVELSEIATTWPEVGVSWLTVAAWIVAVGIAARLLWVVAGVARLRALRRAGIAIADAGYDEIQRTLGTKAELRSVPNLTQPVTFGVRRPVVLLPDRLEASPESIRRAVLTHELVHVRRRDWLWVIAEEALRAAFWFHPAIWWATARIQLTREEFTDHLAVLATGSRRRYMEALLAFAEAVRLEPAPAFARRPHLFHRIILLSKEPAMSSHRIVFSGALITALLATGGWYASEAFPVTARAFASALPRPAAPAAQQGSAAALPVNPITPENPIPRRVFATPIPYPLELAGTKFESAISLRVVLNANGFVASVQPGASAVAAMGASVVTEQQAMPKFVAAAVEAVSQWQYEPPASAPIAFYVGVMFKPGADATVSQSERSLRVAAGPTGARLATGGLQETVTVRSDGAPVRVGGNVMTPGQTRKVNPVYPDVARAARVQGVVILEAVINEQGRVSSTRILRSIPLLDQAAIDAVQQWEYRPTLLNGVPVPVILTTTVQFVLEQ